MLNDTDRNMLKIAYDEACLGFEAGGCPIGSVLARGGQEVSRGHNQRVQQGDPIAHGEMDALRKAGRRALHSTSRASKGFELQAAMSSRCRRRHAFAS